MKDSYKTNNSFLQFNEVDSSELNGVNAGHFIAGFGAGVLAASAGAAVATVILT